MTFPPEITLSVGLTLSAVSAVCGTYGSMGPCGANWSNESADSVGGGDKELLVDGDGWVNTVDGISNVEA